MLVSCSFLIKRHFNRVGAFWVFSNNLRWGLLFVLLNVYLSHPSPIAIIFQFLLPQWCTLLAIIILRGLRLWVFLRRKESVPIVFRWIFSLWIQLSFRWTVKLGHVARFLAENCTMLDDWLTISYLIFHHVHLLFRIETFLGWSILFEVVLADVSSAIDFVGVTT